MTAYSKSQLTLFHGKMKKRDVEVPDGDDGENQSAIKGPCDSYSGY